MSQVTPAQLLECDELFNFIRQHPNGGFPQVAGSAQGAFDVHNVERLKQIKNELLGDELFNLQEAHNDGRGITCVRGVAASIKRGDLAGAYAEACTDWDKISGYRNVAEWLKKNKIVPDTENFYISSIAK